MIKQAITIQCDHPGCVVSRTISTRTHQTSDWDAPLPPGWQRVPNSPRAGGCQHLCPNHTIPDPLG